MFNPCLLLAKLWCILFLASGFIFTVESAPLRFLVAPVDPCQDVKTAITEFNRYHSQLTGKALPVLHSPPEKTGGLFLAQKADFSPQELTVTGSFGGYRIRQKEGNIHIAGASDSAVLYGVYELLEQIGFRFYGEDLVKIPENHAFELPDLDLLKVPAYDIRIVNASENLGAHNLHTRVAYITKRVWEHTNLYLVPPEKYAESHPEYYAMRDGVRQASLLSPAEMYSQWVMLCLSNPKVREIAAENLKLWAENSPGKLFYVVMQMDGYGWCQCPECRKLDPVPGNIHTDRLLDYVNFLARRNPDILVVTAAYCYTAPPPIKIKPEKNVRIFLCPYTPEVGDQGHWFDAPDNRQFLPWYEGWTKQFSEHLYIYDYPLISRRNLSLPHEQMYFRMKRYAQDGIRGIRYCGRPSFMTALSYFVCAKLAWNPELDTAPLTQEFIAFFYGDGADEMQAVYERLKAIALQPDRIQSPAQPIQKFINIPEAEELLTLFDRAEEQVRQNPITLQRVRDEKSFLLRTYLDLYTPIRNPTADLGIFKRRLGEYLNIVVKTKNFFAKFPETLDKRQRSWLWSCAGIDVPEKNWVEDATVRALMTCPDEVTLDIHRQTTLQSIENGWEFPLEMVHGLEPPLIYGYHCPPRKCVLIRNNMTQFSALDADFILPVYPGAAFLRINGQDDDKPEAVHISVRINGALIFEGKNGFPENDWGDMELQIPDGILRTGSNTLRIKVNDDAQNIQTKWIAIHQLQLLCSNPIGNENKRCFFASFKENCIAEHGASKEPVENTMRIFKEALDAGYSAETSQSVLGYMTGNNIRFSAGTISLEMLPLWNLDDSDDHYRTIIDLRGPHNKSGFLLYKYNTRNFLNLLAYTEDGNVLINSPCPEWQAGKWQKISFSWNEEKQTIQLSVNNQKPVCKTAILRNQQNPPTFLYVGSMQKYVRNAGALIRNLTIYDADILHPMQ